MILTTDLHLTDNPNDEYRWTIFDVLKETAQELNDKDIFILGDLTDRKDRHSAELVNRLCSNLIKLTNVAFVTIIKGNHDAPLQGVPYWSFLPDLHTFHNLRFVTKPDWHNHIALLPHADRPREEWSVNGMNWEAAACIFMHQTVTGSQGQNGRELENKHMPPLPDVPIYSGDIHVAQTVGQVCYIGTPYPIDFGDTGPFRLLQLNKQYRIQFEIPMDIMRKHMLRIEDIRSLDATDTKRGDQAKIIFSLDVNALDTWPRIQDEIASWASARDVQIVSCEPEISGTAIGKDATGPAPEADLKTVLAMFGTEEELDARMLEVGEEILNEEIGNV